MFFRKRKQSNTEITENSTDPNPYEDEPNEWNHFSEEQLISTWYRQGLTELPSNLFNLPFGGTEIARLMKESSYDGDQHAQYTLGKMFYNSISVERNYLQAGLWYAKAADSGNPFALYELGKMCSFGIGMGRDPEQAAQFFQKAYEKFLSMENQQASKTVEMKLAVICENSLAIGAKQEQGECWRQKTDNLETVLPQKVQEQAASVTPILVEDDNLTHSKNIDAEYSDSEEVCFQTPKDTVINLIENEKPVTSKIEVHYSNIVEQFNSLQVIPDEPCAVIEDGQMKTGVIERIEIYSTTLLIAVIIDGVHHPYFVSDIGTVLFVGNNYLKKAENIVISNQESSIVSRKIKQ